MCNWKSPPRVDRDKRPRDGRSPDDLACYETVDMLEHQVALIAGFGECRVGVAPEQNGVGTIYADTYAFRLKA